MRVLGLLALVTFVGCGSNDPTDFHTSDRAGAGAGGSGVTQGGSAGTSQGGASGAQPGGSGGAPLGGTGGSAQGGSGAGGMPSGGAAGSPPGGAAGTGLGGTNAGSGGTPSNGGGPNGGAGPRGGTSGSGTTTFSCGSLMCVSDRQYCVRTLPPISGQPEMRMCLPFADSCTTLNCDCFCKAPMNSPCGVGSACMCSNNNGEISVLCGGS